MSQSCPVPAIFAICYGIGTGLKKLVPKKSESVLKKFGTEKSLGIGLKKFGTEKSLGISIVQILGHTLFGKSVKMSPV